MGIQTLIVLAAVAAAAGYFVRKALQEAQGQPGCGSACGSCPSAKDCPKQQGGTGEKVRNAPRS